LCTHYTLIQMEQVR